MSPLNPTRMIGGRYVVLAELGRGGMGVVWRAEDRVMGRQVAVKELHLPDGQSPEERRMFRERLLREARTAGRLNDPGIVTVYDVVTDGGVDHIVMELIEAQSLSDILYASGPMDERAATTVAQQLLAALRTAHDSGVVHRDVKPSNVMIAAGGRVKLTDFGIAQAVDDPRLTSTGLLVGSPAYLSPERLEGNPATPATDMWALGATLFQALKGEPPFARDSTAAVISAVLYAEVPSIRTRGPLGSVIDGLLQRSPQTRLTGAQAAAMLTAQGTAQLPAPAPGGSATAQLAPAPLAPAPAAPVARWRRRWVWLAAALMVGLVAGLLVPTALGGLGGVSAASVTTLTYGAGGDVPVFDINYPTCLSTQVVAGRSFPADATVGCDSPHDAEIYATLEPFDQQRSLAYPGRSQLTAYAGAGCGLLFTSGLITGSDKGSLVPVALVPSEAAFTLRSSGTSFGTRSVICLLRAGNGTQLTGTRIAKDSG